MKINAITRAHCSVGTSAESIMAILAATTWVPNGEVDVRGPGGESSHQKFHAD